MIVKKHMNSDKKDENVLYNNKIEKLTNYLLNLESFVFADYDFDLNSILDICDVLITDYSGVIFDFLYLNRPIITYTPDYRNLIQILVLCLIQQSMNLRLTQIILTN